MIYPKVSIITASYNSEKTITDTIESVLAQNYMNLEFIIIDGNSNDKTIEIVKKYQSNFLDKLKFISEKDDGIYDAWNKGLKIASGDWVVFLGSDDALIKDSITKCINSVYKKNSEINFISSKCILANKDLLPIRTYGKPWSNNMFKYCTIAHVGSYHHKSLFQKKGLFNTNYKISGDYDFLLRCQDIVKPLFIPMETAIVRDGGISGRNIFRVSKEKLNIKIANKCRLKVLCYYDYLITIIKFYIRTMVLNPLILKNKKRQA